MSIGKRTLLGGALLLILCLPSSLSAQTTFATITGTVTDPTGAVIPNVTVTATNVATNVSTTVKSNEAGIYTIATLKEGTYKLAAKNTGFKELIIEGVTLEACREELQSTLEDWLMLGFRLGHEIPVVAGIDLNAKAPVHAEAD